MIGLDELKRDVESITTWADQVELRDEHISALKAENERLISALLAILNYDLMRDSYINSRENMLEIARRALEANDEQ